MKLLQRMLEKLCLASVFIVSHTVAEQLYDGHGGVYQGGLWRGAEPPHEQ
jgi:hypothetical protein